MVFDHDIALQAFRSGGWALAELEGAIAGATEALVHPDSPLGPQVHARGLALGRELVEIDDYADLSQEILQNGLFILERRPGLLKRPGIIVWGELSPVELSRALADWAARAELPTKGRAIALSGAGFFRDRRRVDALTEHIARGPLWLRAVDFTGAADAALLVSAVRAVLSGWVRGPTEEQVQLRLPEDASPELVRVAERLDPLDVDVLARLSDVWRDDETLRRRVDDGERVVFFDALERARRSGDTAAEGRAVGRAEERLGSASRWIRAFRRASMDRRPRLTLIPTWQCELRCKYCTIPKQDGRVMPIRTVERAIDLLLSGGSEEAEVHFFGGEPMSEWELVRHAVEWGTARANEEGRRISFMITTDGFGLNPERLAFLSRFPVRFQLSLDGAPETQNAFRLKHAGGDSYPESPGGKVAMILASGVEHEVIQVVHPRNAERMAENFRHIVGLGYRKLQLNYALGTRWEEPALVTFAEGLMAIGKELDKHRASGDPVELVNLGETLLTVRGNLEVSVDWDGSIFGTSAFLYIPKYREQFRLGHLDDGASFRRYVHDGFPMEHLLAHWYREGMADNNRSVGSVLMSFVRFMRARD